jgi:hypothetical protein
VLINSVLGAIPKFYMSIFKMLVSVRKQIMQLKRRFSWGWELGASKVAWVKWEEVLFLRGKRWARCKGFKVVQFSTFSKGAGYGGQPS